MPTRTPFHLALLALLSLAPGAWAETRSGLVLLPMADDRNAQLTTELNGYLATKTDAGFDYDMRFIATRGRAKLTPEAGRGSPMLGWEFLYIDTDTRDPRIPEHLVDTSIAAGGSMRASESWIVQGTIGFGFAGDKAFSGRGWYGLASLSGTKVFGEGNFLSIGLDFDGNRPIFPDIPIPVVLWTRVWSKKLTTALGIPFLGFVWTPWEWLELNFRGIPGVFQTGGIIVRPTEKWDIFLRYRGANFRFFIDGYSNDNDRLFYSEQRVEFGVTWRPAEQMDFTILAGWAFERDFSTGFDGRDTDTFATIDAAGLFGFAFTLNF